MGEDNLKIEELSKVIIEIDSSNFNDVPLLPSSLSGVVTICPTNLYEGFFISVLRKK